MSNNGLKDKLITVWGLVKKYAKKTWEYIKIAKIELIVMIALFAIDLISKALVDSHVEQYDTVGLIPKFLNVTYVRNYDAAFGNDWMRTHLGIGARIIFCIFAVVASVVFFIMMYKNKGGHKLVRISFAMLIAGAMGNCIDRMAFGYVRDFIEFVFFGGTIFGRESFWIFNIADSSLVIGVILVVIYYLAIYKGKDDMVPESVDVSASNGQTDEPPTAERTGKAQAETIVENDNADNAKSESAEGSDISEQSESADNTEIEEDKGEK